ncbi:uncharacterized protein LOC135386922 [Ornithodoros turicata]|uniref:uncharacterized protein LOC135386922 n=1 Tax=Ornithodoros turicata TaxID=34597 RepID=UPI00313898F6
MDISRSLPSSLRTSNLDSRQCATSNTAHPERCVEGAVRLPKKRFRQDLSAQSLSPTSPTGLSQPVPQFNNRFSPHLGHSPVNLSYQDNYFLQEFDSGYVENNVSQIPFRDSQVSLHCRQNGSHQSPSPVSDTNKTGFERSIYTLLVDLKMSVKCLERKIEEMSNAMSQEKAFLDVELPRFPLGSDDELKDFRTRLSDTNIKGRLL